MKKIDDSKQSKRSLSILLISGNVIKGASFFIRYLSGRSVRLLDTWPINDASFASFFLHSTNMGSFPFG
jgi:hypothetical protein